MHINYIRKHKIKEIHQTDTDLAGKSPTQTRRKDAEETSQTSSSSLSRRADKQCSQYDEAVRMSSTGFEGCGMCKHARLELAPIK